MVKWFDSYRHCFWLLMAVTGWLAANAILIVLNRQFGFHTFIIDQGYFHALFLQMAEGKLPANNVIAPYDGPHIFGYHFSPILYLLAPAYRVWPHAETLFLAQALLIFGPVPLLFHIGKILKISPPAVLLFCLMACLNPYFYRAAFNDFHENTFAVPLMCIGLLGVLQKRFVYVIIACIGLILTKEHYGLSVCGFGLLWAIRHKAWRRGAALALSGVASLVVVLGIILPAWQGEVVALTAHPMNSSANRYHWIKLSWEALLVFYDVLTYGGINGVFYLALLLSFSGCIALLVPAFLLPGLADLLANMLSYSEMMRSPNYYHGAPLVPAFTVAAMVAWKEVWQLTAQMKKIFLGIGVLACAAMMPLTIQHMTFQELPDFAAYRATAVARATIDRELATCTWPLVQSNIASNLTIPAKTSPFVPKQLLSQGDCAVLWFGPLSAGAKANNRAGSPYFPLPLKDYPDMVRVVLNDKGWRITYWNEPWLMLRKAPETGEDKEQNVLRAQAQEALARLEVQIAEAIAEAEAKEKLKKTAPAP